MRVPERPYDAHFRNVLSFHHIRPVVGSIKSVRLKSFSSLDLEFRLGPVSPSVLNLD